MRVGARAAEDLLRRLGVPVSKAGELNPLVDKDFIVLAQRLSKELASAAQDTDEEDLDAAVAELDVDWTALSIEEKEKKFSALKAAILALLLFSVPATTGVLGGHIGKVIQDTKAATIAEGAFQISAAPSAHDVKTGGFIVSSQAAFTKLEYERRAETVAQMVREMVAEGAKVGLDSAGISALVTKAVLLYHEARTKAYWDVTANVLLNRARTGTQINTYAEAGVEKVRFCIVDDGNACEVCSFMDGRVASVSAISSSQRAAEDLADPYDILDAMPWLGHDKTGIYFKRGGVRQDVATDVSTEDLVAEGLFLIPVHGRCRCRYETV